MVERGAREVSKVLAFISPFTNNGAKLEEVKETADAEEIYNECRLLGGNWI